MTYQQAASGWLFPFWDTTVCQQAAAAGSSPSFLLADDNIDDATTMAMTAMTRQQTARAEHDHENRTILLASRVGSPRPLL